MLKRLIENYERLYPYFATAAIVAVLSIGLTVSPLGAKIQKSVTKAFARDEVSGVGIIGQLKNDYGVRPNRFLYHDHAPPTDRYMAVDAPFAKRRTAKPLVFSRDKDRTDLFVIVGAFEFEEGLHGALLIDRKGEVLHRWIIPPRSGRKGSFREDYRVFPHGFALEKDGSAAIAFDGGGRLIRINACGNLLWKFDGPYHHAVVADPETRGDAWTLLRDGALRFNLADGKREQRVQMADVEAANPALDLFGARNMDRFDTTLPGNDPTHFNDVEPLPAALAPKFLQFSAGDLLISARSLNLIFVVDPETKKVKWHAAGYWRRQHDPDWGRDGRIYVFNNNRNRGASSVVAIDPKTDEMEIVVDGARYDLYTNVRGKQQWSDDGRVVLTVSQQGRAVEIDDRGEVSFEFLNRYDAKTGQSLVIADAFRIDRSFLDLDALGRCSG